MIKNKRTKHGLYIGALCVLGLLPYKGTAKAQSNHPTQNPTISTPDVFEGAKFGKFINNDSTFIANGRDTLSVCSIDTVCKLDDYIKLHIHTPGKTIVCDYFYYYMPTPRIEYGDTIAINLLSKCHDLIQEYNQYQDNKEYARRDSVEQCLRPYHQELIARTTKQAKQREQSR